MNQPTDNKIRGPKRPEAVSFALQLEADRHYPKYAFMLVIAYKDEDGKIKVDTASNVSVKDSITLCKYGVESATDLLPKNSTIATSNPTTPGDLQ